MNNDRNDPIPFNVDMSSEHADISLSSVAMDATFGGLPDELFNMICDYFPTHSLDLSSLSRTSKGVASMMAKRYPKDSTLYQHVWPQRSSSAGRYLLNDAPLNLIFDTTTSHDTPSFSAFISHRWGICATRRLNNMREGYIGYMSHGRIIPRHECIWQAVIFTACADGDTQSACNLIRALHRFKQSVPAQNKDECDVNVNMILTNILTPCTHAHSSETFDTVLQLLCYIHVPMRVICSPVGSQYPNLPMTKTSPLPIVARVIRIMITDHVLKSTTSRCEDTFWKHVCQDSNLNFTSFYNKEYSFDKRYGANLADINVEGMFHHILSYPTLFDNPSIHKLLPFTFCYNFDATSMSYDRMPQNDQQFQLLIRYTRTAMSDSSQSNPTVYAEYWESLWNTWNRIPCVHATIAATTLPSILKLSGEFSPSYSLSTMLGTMTLAALNSKISLSDYQRLWYQCRQNLFSNMCNKDVDAFIRCIWRKTFKLKWSSNFADVQTETLRSQTSCMQALEKLKWLSTMRSNNASQLYIVFKTMSRDSFQTLIPACMEAKIPLIPDAIVHDYRHDDRGPYAHITAPIVEKLALYWLQSVDQYNLEPEFDMHGILEQMVCFLCWMPRVPTSITFIQRYQSMLVDQQGKLSETLMGVVLYQLDLDLLKLFDASMYGPQLPREFESALTITYKLFWLPEYFELLKHLVHHFSAPNNMWTRALKKGMQMGAITHASLMHALHACAVAAPRMEPLERIQCFTKIIGHKSAKFASTLDIVPVLEKFNSDIQATLDADVAHTVQPM